MKCQNLFSEKSKRNLPSAGSAQRVVMVNTNVTLYRKIYIHSAKVLFQVQFAWRQRTPTVCHEQLQ